MSTKLNKDTAHHAAKDWNALNGDVTKVRSWYEKYRLPGFIYHHPFSGDMNREQTIQMMVTLLSAFPDLNFFIDDLITERDKMVTRYTMRGTHKGTFRGIPATGKQIVVKGVQIDKGVGGKSSEVWDFPDLLGMMTQLGIVPSTAPKT